MSVIETSDYLAFPFQIGVKGAVTARRSEHVRQIIEQVLFTMPPERVFRPEFGAGAQALVFEPAKSLLSDVVRKRVFSSLAEALRGEVDSKSLRVEVAANPDHGEQLLVTIEYQFAALGKMEQLAYPIAGGSYG